VGAAKVGSYTVIEGSAPPDSVCAAQMFSNVF
jgi:hypothetical protein